MGQRVAAPIIFTIYVATEKVLKAWWIRKVQKPRKPSFANSDHISTMALQVKM